MTANADTKNVLVWMDIARIAAICFVITVHSAGYPVTVWATNIDSKWHIANFYDSLARNGVPLFIMISGALLIPRNESVTLFYKKRFPRVLLPYIIWSIIYLLVFSKQINLTEALSSGRVYYHFGFVNYFLGIYLFAPFFSLMCNKYKTEVNYFLFIWIFLASLFPMISSLTRMLYNQNVSFIIDAPQFSGYFGYFILGYVLFNTSIKNETVYAVLCFLLSALMTIAGTFLCTKYTGVLQQTFYEYTSINIIGMSASLFIIIKNVLPKITANISSRQVFIIRHLSRLSYGVYFVHVIFFYIINLKFGRIFDISSTISPLITIPLSTLVTFILSYISIHLLCLIPKAEKYLT